MQRIYNKLVRDNIPEIIRKSGEIPVVRKLDNTQYLEALHQKLQEEVTEYLRENCLAELCDILEVVEALVQANGHTLEEASALKETKAGINGSFREKLFLEKVIPDKKVCE